MSRWTPVLASTALEDQAWRVVDAIAQRHSDALVPEEDLGLAGSASWALLFAYLAQERGDERSLDRASTWLNHAVDAASAHAAPRVGLERGLAGTGWIVDHVLAMFESPSDEASIELDELLLAVLADASNPLDVELSGGIAGIGLYFLEGRSRASAREGLTRVLGALSERADVLPYGVAWRKPMATLSDEQRAAHPHGLYNLGVPHGVPGVIGFLAMAWRDTRSDVAARLLDGAVHWLLRQAAPDGPVRFPRMVDAHAEPRAEWVRMGWCYGDLAVATTLLSAATCRDRADWASAATDLAVGAACRSVEDAGVEDDRLCHGSAGIAHQFNRCWQASGHPALRAAAVDWFEHTLGRVVPSGSGGLLLGPPGLGLALLAAVGRVAPDWDRCLGISVAPEGSRG